MSYVISEALQMAVYGRLRADAGVAAHVGDAVFDAVPMGNIPDLYIAIGAETVRDRSDISGKGGEHDLIVTVMGRGHGFAAAKQAASAVAEALDDAPLILSRGELRGIQFVKARARVAQTGDIRRIDMTFRARVAG